MLAILGLMGTPGANASPVPVPDAIYRITETQLNEDAKDREAPQSAPPSYMFIPLDIDRDGRTDWRVDYYRAGSPGFCGTGGCLQQLYVARPDGTFVLAFDQQVNYFRIEPGDARSRFVIVDVHGTFCGGAGNSDCQLALRWDAEQQRMVPTVAPGTTSAIMTFDPLPNSGRDLPPAIAAQANAAAATCKRAGFALGEGVDGGSVKPTLDFNGDGIADWLVGIEAYCYKPGHEDDAEPPKGPDIPLALMLSKGGSFEKALTFQGSFFVDISASRPVLVEEADGSCHFGLGTACPTTSFVWDPAAGAMRAFPNASPADGDAALLARFEQLAAAPRWPTGATTGDLGDAKALMDRFAAERAPSDPFLARARFAYGVLMLEHGDTAPAEEALRRARDAFILAGAAANDRIARAQLFLGRAIPETRSDERVNALGRAIDQLERNGITMGSWAMQRAYELYVTGLYRDRNFQIGEEKLADLLASDAGRGPDAWAERREIDRYAAAFARSKFRWSQALSIDEATIARISAGRGANEPGLVEDYAAKAIDLTSLARFGEAEQASRSALAIAEKAFGPQDRRTLMARSDLGDVLLRAGRADEAEALQRRVIASLDLGGDPQSFDVPLVYRRLAENALALGQLAEAGTLLEKARGAEDALDGQHILSSTYDRATTIRMLGRLEVLTGQGRKAAETFAQGTVEAGALGPETLAMLLDYLEFADRFATDDERALLANYAEAQRADSKGVAERVLELAQGIYAEPHPEIARARRLLARILGEQNDEEAASAFDEAIAAERALPGDGTAIGHEVRLDYAAFLLAHGGDRAQAHGLAREAVTIARERRARLRASGGTILDPAIRRAFVLFAGAIADANDPGEAALDEAFRTLQDAEVSQAGIAVARATLARQANSPALARQFAAFNAAEQHLTALERVYLAALAAGDGEGVQRLQGELTSGRAAVQSLDEQLRQVVPAYGALADQQPVGLATARQRLGPDEVIVILTGDDEDIVGMALSRTQARLVRAGGYAPQFARDLAALRCTVDPGNCPGPVQDALDARLDAAGWKSDDPRLPFDRAAAHAIYSRLIQPLAGAFGKDATLLLVQHGEIGKLSLAMLPVDDPQGADPFDPAGMGNVSWLVDQHALVLLPSVSVLGQANVARATGAAASSFVGFGNPVLHGTLASGRGLSRMFVRGGAGGWMATPTQLADLAPLPATQHELEAMAGVMKADATSIVTGSSAREAAVKADARLANSRVVAFATHGLLPNELQGLVDPGLVFTPPAKASAEDDGVLTASEVTALALRAEWVVLSACNTASSDGSPGTDSLSALARSFLLSGAKSVLASRWSVPDASTAALTVATLDAFEKEGVSRAQALRRGMIAVRLGRGPDGAALSGWTAAWAHPISWAAFVLISAQE